MRDSLGKVLRGDNPGGVADDDHGTWFRELFAPSVAAGLLRPAALAGCRCDRVHIHRSRHVPPDRAALGDAMPAFFEHLRGETALCVRVVLGHFVFVHMHPYTDGNGRMGRFLMNVMLAAGGYAWTAVPPRDAYMAALQAASIRQDIVPFTGFLADLVETGISGGAAARGRKGRCQ